MSNVALNIHIAIVIDSLKPGGSERVACEMANYWALEGKRVTLITFKNDLPFYSLHEKVHYLAMGIAGGSGNWISGILNTYRRIRALRRELKKLSPDAVIGFFADINSLLVLSAKTLQIPVVLSERNHPVHHRIPLKWRLMRRMLYPVADRLVLQTHDAAQWYRRFKIPYHVIPNPLRDIEEKQGEKQHMILAAGRLTHQKGFDLLLEAYARSGLYPEWQLVIAGEGQERMNLENQASRLGVKQGVSFPGVVEDIDSYYHQASLFVLSSRYEGYPNVLAEAMAAGVPCISFNCPYGPAHMIRHEETGLLVKAEDVEALGRSLYYLSAHSQIRRYMSQKASREIRQQLDQDKIMGQWEAIIEDLVPGRITGKTAWDE